MEASSPTRARAAPFLIVGDPGSLRAQGRALREQGIDVVEVDEERALEVAQTLELAGAVVIGRAGLASALSLFHAVHGAQPTLPIVVASREPTVGEAVKLMQLGARSCVPIVGGGETPAPELMESVREILDERQSTASPDRARRMGAVAVEHGLVGESAPMKAVLHDVALVAPTRTTVLILGETGTGKERVAQAIHQSSPRRHASFVAVSCAAITETLLESALFGHEKGAFSGAHCRREGLFKIADGGTLFLDEIGETSPALQAKLLRVLQERQFERVGGTTPVSTDVRVIAATNRDLRRMVAERMFRSDLFYRLNVMVINVPSLRHRRDDLEPLVSHILARLSFELGIPRPSVSREVMARLGQYGWPGNVRELENVLERLLVVSQDRTVGLADLPAELRLGEAGTPPPEYDWPAEPAGAAHAGAGWPQIPGATFREIERHAILTTYEACGQSPSRTAHILGLSLRTVHYRLREYRGEDGRRAPAVMPRPGAADGRIESAGPSSARAAS